MNMPEKEDTLLTTKDVMQRLHVARETIYMWLRRRQITGYRVGGTWRFSQSEIQARVDEQQRQQDAKRMLAQKREARMAEQMVAQQLSWGERRMAYYVKTLVEAEQPVNDEERQRMHDDWYAQGEDVVLEAMRYAHKKARDAKCGASHA